MCFLKKLFVCILQNINKDIEELSSKTRREIKISPQKSVSRIKQKTKKENWFRSLFQIFTKKRTISSPLLRLCTIRDNYPAYSDKRLLFY